MKKALEASEEKSKSKCSETPDEMSPSFKEPSAGEAFSTFTLSESYHYSSCPGVKAKKGKGKKESDTKSS